MKRTIVFIASLLIAFAASAQFVIVEEEEAPEFSGRPRFLKGQVMDAFTGAAIKDVEVSLYRDSTLLEKKKVEVGHFSESYKVDAVYDFLIGEEKTDSKNYLLRFTHPQYATATLAVSTKKYGRRITIDLPDVYMNRIGSLTESTLKELTVVATKVKLYHKGDTLVYNADAFNVPDGSMLDELIRQMPGTELKPNGEIFVNGKKIDYLLLNGQDFFRGRNKLMLENLPYYTVETVKVYNRTTDRAMALNDLTAPKDYVMDVNLKKEYRTGYMVNMEAGGGNHESYLARLFGLRYSDHARLTLIGNSNNTNLSGGADSYGFDERLTTNEALTTKHSAELDWLLTRNKYKNDLTFGFGHDKTESGETGYAETFHGQDGSTYSMHQRANESKALSLDASNVFTLKKPFWLESRTRASYSNARQTELERSGNAFDDVWHTRRIEYLDSLLAEGVPVVAASVQNASRREYEKSPNSTDLQQNLSLAKDLTNGDIIDLNVNVNYTDRDYDATRREKYLFWQSTPGLTWKNEDISGGRRNLTLDSHLSYKLKDLWLCDWTLFTSYRHGRTKDSESILNTDTQLRDEQNSYHYLTNENTWSAGLDFHRVSGLATEEDLLVLGATLPVSIKHLGTDYHRSTLDTCLTQHHVFFEPTLSAEYTNGRNELKLGSDYHFTLPEATQLISMPVTTNLINTYVGNADLKPSSSLNVSLSYKRTLRSINYLTNQISFAKTYNQIVNAFTYNPTNGTYLFRPENVDGAWNMTYENRCWYYLKETKSATWVVKWEGSLRYAENVNFFSNVGQADKHRSMNKSLHAALPFSFGYFSKDFECSVDGRFAWNHAFNNITDVAYADAFDYGAGLRLKKKLFWGISGSTDFNVYMRSAYSGSDLNKTEYVWDFTLSKTILKEKLTFRLSAIDVLRNRSSLVYTVNSQGVSEIQKTKMPGYLLLTASYKMHKNPKAKKMN